MRGCLPRTVHGRAIISVVALYALLLQAFLGGLVARPLAPVGNEVCAEHIGVSLPREHAPACLHNACCTVAHANELFHPLLEVFATVAWASSVRVSVIPWRDAGSVQARAPPDQSVSPRGPPTT